MWPCSVQSSFSVRLRLFCLINTDQLQFPQTSGGTEAKLRLANSHRGKPRHKQSYTRAPLSWFLSFRRVCFNMHTGLLLFPPLSLFRSPSLTVRYFCPCPYISACAVCQCCMCLCARWTGLLIWRRSHDSAQLMLRAKACWKSSGCRHPGCSTLLFAPRFVCVNVYVFVYRVLMCALVFLGLQTRMQLVLANGLYGKTFKWYKQLITNTSCYSGEGVATS